MPIYEYVCATCGKEFEAIQKFSDPPLTHCQCSSEGKVQRKLSLTAFHLHGGGWYNEGYAHGSKGGDSTSISPKAEGSKSGDAKASAAEGGSKGGEAKAAPTKAEGSSKAAAKSSGKSSAPSSPVPAPTA